jgi:homeobox protein cut-like
VTKLVELDTIVDELQRANERVATVERRNELLRSEIERVRSDTGETDR